MKGHILCGETLLSLPSARVAKDDVEAFLSSTDLLQRTKAIKDQAVRAAEAAEAEGFERGKQQALDEMRDRLTDALASLTRSFTKENERRERGTAAAAMQVIERLIGQIEDDTIITGLAREALKQSGAGALTLHVAPQWVETVHTKLSDYPDLAIEADPALDLFGCRVASQDGRIIADLDTQLSALRSRWGLDAQEGDA